MVDRCFLGGLGCLEVMAWVGGDGLVVVAATMVATMAVAVNDGGDGGEMLIFHHRCQYEKPIFPPSFPCLTFVVCCLQGEEGGMGRLWRLLGAATMAVAAMMALTPKFLFFFSFFRRHCH